MSLHSVDLLPEAEQTVDGEGAVLDMSTLVGGTSQFLSGVFQLVVADAQGVTPTLDAFVQMEMPDKTYNDIVAFTRMTGVGKRVAVMVSQAPRGVFVEGPSREGSLTRGTTQEIPLGPRYRVKWAIGGVTPSFTFAVKADLYD